MYRSARAIIHSLALRHNLNQARKAAPDANVMAIIKANAYGHGVIQTAEILEDRVDGFGVSCFPEALELHDSISSRPIMVLQGHQSQADLQAASEKHLRLVLHEEKQLSLLDDCPAYCKIDVALKIDTGMHRLGFPPEQATEIYTKLIQHTNIKTVWLMTHLACADEPQKPYTQMQLDTFDRHTKNITTTTSIANSAGILGSPNSHRDWIRPGIMLYGSSPFVNGDVIADGLQASMTLTAPLISIHSLKKGDAIGYGSTWQCPTDMQVGVVACGYADGYPRHAPSGTPVWLNGRESRILGRVSMDMIVIDLQNQQAQVGDNVELWGKHIRIDRIADAAETIAYELLCNAGNNCPKTYS